jgi:sulfatase modifying factor 1
MKKMKQFEALIFISFSAILRAIPFIVFTSCIDSSGRANINEGDVNAKIDAAISCTPNGLTVADKTIYMKGGGSEFSKTIVNDQHPPKVLPEGMVWIPGGEFSMGGIDPVGMHDGGSESMIDARPVHRVHLKGFFMDATEVTNKEFSAFVKATGYKTVAEIKPTKEEFPTAPEENLVAGSVVFTPASVANLQDHYQWWNYKRGADWKHPEGVGSDIIGKDNYPVVQIAWDDAAAYATWAGKRLPTEAEWEFAARAGSTGDLYTWGNQFRPGGKWMANTYQGKFPQYDSGSDGFTGIAPVKQFEANGYGLYDMAGNVWEWCSDWYRPNYYQTLTGKVANNPRGPADSDDPAEPGQKKKVQRGGSFLCTDQYCTRYMVGTRGKGEYRSAANHVGFRCVKDIL